MKEAKANESILPIMKIEFDACINASNSKLDIGS
jgi:hypothetical protein